MTDHPLDNPIWHMLVHDIPEHTTGTDLARRCDPDLFPVAALAEHSDEAFADLASLFATGDVAVIGNAVMPTHHPGFELEPGGTGLQMVCQQRLPVPATDFEVLELTKNDVSEMAQLIELTEPGPFFPRLMTIRRYVGIRQHGELVAIAGERLQLPGYCEITAVCTHPDWRGRGYARHLTTVIADGIWQRGSTPILHVIHDNHAARRVYEALDFQEKRDINFMSITRL